jgi:hypothetical protein
MSGSLRVALAGESDSPTPPPRFRGDPGTCPLSHEDVRWRAVPPGGQAASGGTREDGLIRSGEAHPFLPRLFFFSLPPGGGGRGWEGNR